MAIRRMIPLLAIVLGMPVAACVQDVDESLGEAVDESASALAAELEGPTCDAFGCDYEYRDADGNPRIHTTLCSIECSCPAIPGMTVRHARCYPKAAPAQAE